MSTLVGNEFILPKQQVAAAMPASASPGGHMPIFNALGDINLDFENHEQPVKTHRRSFWQWLSHHWLGVFGLLFLLVGAASIYLAGIYWSEPYVIETPARSSQISVPALPAKGPNAVFKTSEAEAYINKIATQPINISVNGKTISVNSDTIKSWLQVTADKKTGVTYVHVNQHAVNEAIAGAGVPYIKSPTDQIVMTGADGSSRILTPGRNGTKIGDTSNLSKALGSQLLSAKGMNIDLPVITEKYAVASAATIAKLIEVNVVTKQMYLYDNGVLTKQYPISAGAPETPTPIGQYKIYQKLNIQDMRGYNVNGTKYFQPNVRYVNYFLAGGYAIHGNYWRPQSWFGAINSSHGCVSLPDDQAKEVYDWAPIGTTVITHY